MAATGKKKIGDFVYALSSVYQLKFYRCQEWSELPVQMRNINQGCNEYDPIKGQVFNKRRLDKSVNTRISIPWYLL